MKLTPTLLSLVLFTAATQANAALVSALGGQAVNDTDLNIAWVADANLAASNSFGVSGISPLGYMTWSTAQQWIGGMNAANYLGYNDWRLPSTIDTGTAGCNYSTNGTDCGYNSSGSEMSHLFYTELGNKGAYDTAGVIQPGYGLNNKGPFSNFQPDFYWSGTEYAPNTNMAWIFYTETGYQNTYGKNFHNFLALAVRSGQVSLVPEPSMAWLMLAGVGVIGVRRRWLALR